MTSTYSPSLMPFARAGALLTAFATLTACAPGSTLSAAVTAGQAPVLLSCPAGQQPLLRQVTVNGNLVPQIECVTAQASVAGQEASQAASVPAPVAWAGAPQAYAPQGYAPQGYASQPPAPQAAPVVYGPVYAPSPAPAPMQRVSTRPAPRRVVYGSDIEEYRAPRRRTLKKSAVIIGSSAGVGAGIGAATGGKKGALIGAAVGGGAAAIWDQVTRRQ